MNSDCSLAKYTALSLTGKKWGGRLRYDGQRGFVGQEAERGSSAAGL